MSNTLDVIIKYKKEQIAKKKKALPLEKIKRLATEQPSNRGFFEALERNFLARIPGIIAECKKGSPSRGIIVPEYNAEDIAANYERSGATCLSVLTDTKFFHGANNDLVSVKAKCTLPILRKDFIVDSYQVFETKALGADCILLIVSCLTDQQLEEFYSLSIEIGLDVLIEVHDRLELERGLRLRSPLLGINNRNLKIFETNIQNTIDLLVDIPEDRIVVSESGISTRQDIEVLQKNGVNCFLIGETFLRSENPSKKMKELFQELT